MAAWCRMLACGLFATTLSGVANAVVLTTPIVVVNNSASNTVVNCTITNLTGQAHSVDIELIDSHGATIAKVTRDMPANGGYHYTTAPGGNAYKAVYCKFTVPDVVKSNLRAGIYTPGTGISFPAE